MIGGGRREGAPRHEAVGATACAATPAACFGACGFSAYSSAVASRPNPKIVKGKFFGREDIAGGGENSNGLPSCFCRGLSTVDGYVVKLAVRLAAMVHESHGGTVFVGITYDLVGCNRGVAGHIKAVGSACGAVTTVGVCPMLFKLVFVSFAN